MRKRKWAIVAYTVGQRPGRDYIQSSIGQPYNELRKIARSMCSNGEGFRYAVVEWDTKWREEFEK
jgi:hypothetical protein